MTEKPVCSIIQRYHSISSATEEAISSSYGISRWPRSSLLINQNRSRRGEAQVATLSVNKILLSHFFWRTLSKNSHPRHIIPSEQIPPSRGNRHHPQSPSISACWLDIIFSPAARRDNSGHRSERKHNSAR